MRKNVLGEVMHLRLLSINGKKNVPLERNTGTIVATYQNTVVSLSLYTNDGSMLAFNNRYDKVIKSNPS